MYLSRVGTLQSVLCVGLDPTPKHVPSQFGTGLTAMETYLRNVIEIAANRVPVVKPQYAYYAAMEGGVEMMIRLIEYAKSLGLLVILDAKRADIDETMERYGDEVFGLYGADACTFVPYLGPTFQPSDASPSWSPWLAKGKMPISMIRTSNRAAHQIQDLKLASGLRVYEHMATLVKKWDRQVRQLTEGQTGVGGVVGATWPKQAPRCRELAGDDVFLLIPGYGAQGGGSDGAVGGLPNSEGILLGTVNNSRGTTLYSWYDRSSKEPKKGDPLELVVASIDAANKDLNGAIVRKLGISMDEAAARCLKAVA